MKKHRLNRAVTIRCVVCGLEVTGVEDAEGVVRPHSYSRPPLDAPVKPGYCMAHADRATR